MGTVTVIAAILLVSSGTALQAAVGFGGTLFTLPLLVCLGVPLPTAIGLMKGAGISQAVWSCFRYREHVPWGRVMPMVGLRVVGLPLGLVGLTLLAAMDPADLKQAIGVLVLAMVILQASLRVKPVARVKPGWTLLSGVGSGFLLGLAGMGGPPLVLWAMAHDWSPGRTRSFLWAVFLISTPALLVPLAVQFGWPILTSAGLGLACTPIVLVSTVLGEKLGARMSRPTLHTSARLLLIALALGCIAAPWISWVIGR